MKFAPAHELARQVAIAPKKLNKEGSNKEHFTFIKSK